MRREATECRRYPRVIHQLGYGQLGPYPDALRQIDHTKNLSNSSFLDNTRNRDLNACEPDGVRQQRFATLYADDDRSNGSCA